MGSVSLCNLLLRLSLAVLLYVTMSIWIKYLPVLSTKGDVHVLFSHIGFNFLLVVIFAPVAGRLARMVLQIKKSRLYSKNGDGLVMEIGSALDPTLYNQPKAAFTCARREAYRSGDLTESYFSRALDMFTVNDESHIDRVIGYDQEINERNKAIQRYLSEVRRAVSKPESERLHRTIQPDRSHGGTRHLVVQSSGRSQRDHLDLDARIQRGTGP